MSYKAGIVSAITELEGLSAGSGTSSSPSSTAIKKAMQAKLAKDKRWMNGTYLSTLKKMVADKEVVQDRDSYTLSAEYKKKVTALRTKPKKKAAPSIKLDALAVAANAELLANELSKYGLQRRSDSRLCDAFVNGTTDKTAEEVALVMCRMNYLYGGYCTEFNKEMREVEEAIEAETEFIAKQYADSCSGFEGYYSGITCDACREVTGESHFGGYKRGIAESWKKFPAEWPWMKDQNASASNADKNRKKKGKKKIKPVPKKRRAAKGGSGMEEQTAGEAGAKLPIDNLPEAILENIASHLPKISVALLASALTASSTKWGDSNWELEPSAASKAVASVYNNEHDATVLNFEDIDDKLMYRMRLSDNDIGALLVCIDAKQHLKRLTLSGYFNGKGLEPLRASVVLEQFDCGSSQYTSVDAVAPILNSIVETEGHSLKHVRLRGSWFEHSWKRGTEVKNEELGRFLETFEESLNSRPFECLGCSDRGACMGAGESSSWFSEHSKEATSEWVAHYKQYWWAPYMYQKFTCYSCLGNFCSGSDTDVGVSFCKICQKNYCGICAPKAKCHGCGVTHDVYDDVSGHCDGCSQFQTCEACEKKFCMECASGCGCSRTICRGCQFWCDRFEDTACRFCAE